jgi:hypothetical protein
VYLVGITNQDFFDPALYDGTSPLDPDAIRRVLTRVAAQQPSCIVLDHFLQPNPSERGPRAAARSRLYAQIDSCLRNSATDWIIADVDERIHFTSLADSGLVRDWRRLRGPRTGDRGRLLWASAAVEQEDVRFREIPTHTELECDGTKRPTLLGAYLERGGSSLRTGGAERRVGLRCSFGLRLSTDACSDSLIVTTNDMASSEGHLLRTWPAAAASPALEGMTVVIGGVHEAGHDMYSTPWGRRAGVELWAEAIDDLYRPKQDRTFGLILGKLLNTLCSVAFGCMLLLVRGFWRRLAAAIVFVLFLTAGATIAYFWTGLLYNVGLMFVFVWLEVQRLATEKLEERVDPGHPPAL